MKVMVSFQSTTKREMPYVDPERQREAVKVWQQAHPERIPSTTQTNRNGQRGFSRRLCVSLAKFLIAAFSEPAGVTRRDAHSSRCRHFSVSATAGGRRVGKRCEATAQSALGWYGIDPVLVSQRGETFGGYRSSGVLRLTIFSSVQ